jgi:hypothetical protein
MRLSTILTTASFSGLALGHPSLTMVAQPQINLRLGFAKITVETFSDFTCGQETGTVSSPEGCTVITDPTMSLSDNRLDGPDAYCGCK